MRRDETRWELGGSSNSSELCLPKYKCTRHDLWHNETETTVSASTCSPRDQESILCSVLNLNNMEVITRPYVAGKCSASSTRQTWKTCGRQISMSVYQLSYTYYYSLLLTTTGVDLPSQRTALFAWDQGKAIR